MPNAEALAGAGDANTFKIRLEYALVITFLYGRPYDCNEYCKYYKNIENSQYKFIPAVNRTYYDGSTSHVTGIVNISAEDYERMPSRFDGQWLRPNFPHVAESMDRFIAKMKQETNGEIVGELEIIRIPLDLYHARNATSRESGSGLGPASMHSAVRRCFSSAIRRWAHPTSSRSPSASSARCFWLVSCRSLTCPPHRCSIATSCSRTAVASRVHAEQDDQAQQGSLGVRRGYVRAAGEAARVLREVSMRSIDSIRENLKSSEDIVLANGSVIVRPVAGDRVVDIATRATKRRVRERIHFRGVARVEPPRSSCAFRSPLAA